MAPPRPVAACAQASFTATAASTSQLLYSRAGELERPRRAAARPAGWGV
eukprot:COSAG01_NODE_3819_length_5665_cov_12.197808_1_plen_48_part_10